MNRPDPDTAPHRTPSAETPAVEPQGWRETREAFQHWCRSHGLMGDVPVTSAVPPIGPRPIS